jgi:hypothetical protein
VKQWKLAVSAPLRVYSRSAPIVQLNTDPSRDPRKLGAIRIKRFVVQAAEAGRRVLILQTEISPSLSVPFSFDVSAVLGEQTIPLGQQWAVSDEGGHRTAGNSLTVTIETLDPAVRQADIVLTPNPSHIEHRPEVKEIWGGKIVLRGVPIERLDLEVGPR